MNIDPTHDRHDDLRALGPPWETETAAAAATSHLGDVAAMGVGVGLAAAVGSARPTSTAAAALAKRVTSPISATNTAASTGPTPRDLLDRLVAGMALEAAVDAGVALADLAVVELDQVAQRLDPVDVDVAQLQLVEPALPARPPDRLRAPGSPLPCPAPDAPGTSSPARSRASLAR